MTGKPLAHSLFGFILLCYSCLAVKPAYADTDKQRINKVKAAFIINIARYVSWPTSTTIAPTPMLICYYTSNFLGHATRSIAKQTIAGRPLTFATIDTLKESNACNIILVPSSQLQNFELEVLEGYDRAVLTIADLTNISQNDNRIGKAHTGVLVTLVRKGSGIGFEINLPRSIDVGVKMSSELLRLATIVGD